jgi:hypothetical protein
MARSFLDLETGGAREVIQLKMRVFVTEDDRDARAVRLLARVPDLLMLAIGVDVMVGCASSSHAQWGTPFVILRALSS